MLPRVRWRQGQKREGARARGERPIQVRHSLDRRHTAPFAPPPSDRSIAPAHHCFLVAMTCGGALHARAGISGSCSSSSCSSNHHHASLSRPLPLPRRAAAAPQHRHRARIVVNHAAAGAADNGSSNGSAPPAAAKMPAVGGVMTDETVPEGHQGLHGFLYGSEGADVHDSTDDYEFRQVRGAGSRWGVELGGGLVVAAAPYYCPLRARTRPSSPTAHHQPPPPPAASRPSPRPPHPSPFPTPTHPPLPGGGRRQHARPRARVPRGARGRRGAADGRLRAL